jgi:ankyrin repeat protein
VSPDSIPGPTSLEQHRLRAKDLIRAARRGDAAALARIRAVRPDAGTDARRLALADAQLAVARQEGFGSWPKLVAHLEARDVRAFCDAVDASDVPRVRELLERPHVRERVNDPLFDFGQRAAHKAARNSELLAVLIDAGADLNRTSDWSNGPYTVLDNADEATARFLIARGAVLTPNVAARLGWLDELRAFISAAPNLVDARGGDGQRPLHEAKTVAIADYLLDHGADIDARCTDHASTPAQYALMDRPDVCRRLLERGATPDIFMAARLGDVRLAMALLDKDPGCAAARVNEPGYAPVPPFNIYCWSIGFGVSPHEVAAKFGHAGVHDLLMSRSPTRLRFMLALLAADERAARAAVAEDPSLPASLTPKEHGQLAHAIFQGRFDAADLMLRYGFDPAAPGVDGGSALHAACWVGSARMVEQLLARGDAAIEARDPTHGSTPLGWAAFGSVHRRAPGADYPLVIDRLVDAGADVGAPGNRAGLSLVEMARGNATVQAALRRHGAD